MSMITSSFFKNIRSKALRLAALGALIISVGMNFAYVLNLYYHQPERDLFDLLLIGKDDAFRTIGLFFVIIFPALLGGVVVTHLLQKDYKSNRLTMSRSMIQSGVIGMLLAFVFSLLVILFDEIFFYGFWFPIAAFFTSSALFLAFIIGAFVGRRLYIYIVKKEKV